MFFDKLAAAFENDDTLGDREAAGLKNKVTAQQITWLGPKPEGMAALFEEQKVTEQQAIPGRSIKELAEEAGVPIRYSCMKGTCRICDVRINGEETPACMAKLSRGQDLTIEYRTLEDAAVYAKEEMFKDATRQLALVEESLSEQTSRHACELAEPVARAADPLRADDAAPAARLPNPETSPP